MKDVPGGEAGVQGTLRVKAHPKVYSYTYRLCTYQLGCAIYSKPQADVAVHINQWL